MASTSVDRTRAVSLVSGGNMLGNMLGPSASSFCCLFMLFVLLAIQLLFTPLSYPGIEITDRLLINIYTGPAVAACLINAVGIFFLWRFFIEDYAGILESSTPLNVSCV